MADVDKIDRLVRGVEYHGPFATSRGRTVCERKLLIPVSFGALWAVYDPESLQASTVEQSGLAAPVVVWDRLREQPRWFGRSPVARRSVQISGLAVSEVARNDLFNTASVPNGFETTLLTTRVTPEIDTSHDLVAYYFDRDGRLDATGLSKPFTDKRIAEHRDNYHQLVDALLVFAARDGVQGQA